MLERDTTIQSLQVRLAALTDVQNELQLERKAHDECLQERDQLRQELENAETFIRDLEEKFLASRHEALELLKELKNREAQCQDYLL